MPISGTDLRKMTDSQLLELFQRTTCVYCGVALHESTTGCRQVEGGCACSDCYFRTFSDVLEQYPISVPRMLRRL